jgi:hypothetical protein
MQLLWMLQWQLGLLLLLELMLILWMLQLLLIL